MAPLFTSFRFGFGRNPETAAVAVPFSATGGNVANGLEPGNGWVYHTFTSSGTFVITGAPSGTNLEFLLIGGGGGGGGGAQSNFYGESESVGTQPLIPGVTENEYGFDGGYGSDNSPQGYKGGGGGGAGSAGENYAQGCVGGNGKQYPAFSGPLIGIPTLNPANSYWAAGGSGGSGGPGNFPGIPGRTGLTGSTPDSPGPNAGGSATANTGSGGGAASGNPYPPGPDAPGANGADGILIVRYQS